MNVVSVRFCTAVELQHALVCIDFYTVLTVFDYGKPPWGVSAAAAVRL